MPKIEVDCRNFPCSNNVKGDCHLERITLVPVGGIVDKLTCVEATEEDEEPVDADRVAKKNLPEPIPDQ